MAYDVAICAENTKLEYVQVSSSLIQPISERQIPHANTNDMLESDDPKGPARIGPTGK